MMVYQMYNYMMLLRIQTQAFIILRYLVRPTKSHKLNKACVRPCSLEKHTEAFSDLTSPSAEQHCLFVFPICYTVIKNNAFYVAMLWRRFVWFHYV